MLTLVGFFFFLITACTTRSINLRADLPPEQRSGEVARLLSSSLATVKVLDEDIPRLMDALTDEMPQIRQFAIRILTTSPREDIYQAISERLVDENEEVRKEALSALLRAPTEYRNILYKTIIEGYLHPNYRDPLVGRISQFGAPGEALLIELLSHPDLAIARISARNLKRLHPDYPNPTLKELLSKKSIKSKLATSAWLASYNDLAAVKQQLLLSIDPSLVVARRASVLFKNAGMWIIPIIERILSSQEFFDPRIRKMLIQKLIENKNSSAQPYLGEFFSYVTNAEDEALCIDYIIHFNKPGFEQVKKSLASDNLNTQKTTLRIAQNFQDKDIVIASIPLLNSRDKVVKELSTTYIKKSLPAMAEELSAIWDIQRNNASDRQLFSLLFESGSPQILWVPYKKDVDPQRLNYVFRNVSETQFLGFLKKNKNIVYTLELRLIYQLFKSTKIYQNSSSSYTQSSHLIQKNLKIIDLSLQQENPQSIDLSSRLKQEIQEWQSMFNKSTREERQTFQLYRNEAIKLYQEFLAIFPSYRELARFILEKNGIDINFIRGISTYSPRA
ncbi:MAG: HEAT repeat domain-containing protein [Spirochaetia bacterium]